MSPDCAKEWSRKFIRISFTGAFLNSKYKLHRQRLLYEQERAFMPATQIYVEREIESERLAQSISVLEREIGDLQLRRATLYRERSRILAPIRANEHAAAAHRYTHCCPNADCRGFLDKNWSCGICKTVACIHCREILPPGTVSGETVDGVDPHVCDPDRVATTQLLDKDTRPCPTCRTPIFKIAGCDQMWCTQCRTAFSWRTGAIETVIHNPHYYEWMRMNNNAIPRNPLDVVGGACGERQLGNVILERIIRRFRTYCSPNSDTYVENRRLFDRYSKIIQNTIHLQLVGIRRYELPNRTDEEFNRQIRIQYMRNTIDESKFKSIIDQQNKRREKYREYHNILTTFITVVTDLLWKYHDELVDIDHVNTTETEVDAILTYVNDCLSDIGNTYGSTVYHITPVAIMKRIDS